MDRRAFLSGLTLGMAWAPFAAEAQPTGRVYRVGYLSSSGTLNSPYAEAFRQGLRDLGWVEGQNIVIEFRSAEEFDRLPALATELVRLKVDVVPLPVSWTHEGDTKIAPHPRSSILT